MCLTSNRSVILENLDENLVHSQDEVRQENCLQESRMMRVGHTIIFVCFCLLPVIFGDSEKNETTFVPTREWQVVKKGTPIPKGLHVRHNFQTGVTEAKLMDPETDEEKLEEDTNSKSLTLHPDKSVPDANDEVPVDVKRKPDPLSYPINELKARLKKIKEEEIQVVPDPEDKANQEETKQKFRDYDTIKKELKALEINITTDPELISSYFQKFELHKNGIAMGTLSGLEVEEVLDVLDGLGFLVSYIDNAKVFADMQGMSKIVSPCLNGTNNQIKAEALKLLGAAVQSNPKVQLKALETDFVQKILYILSTNSKLKVKSRCLFALSALVRQFPAAQKAWIDHGGLEIFVKILVDGQLPIQIKVLKLINDLLIERQNLGQITDSEQRKVRTEAYEGALIESKLLIHDYCMHLSNLLTKTFKKEFDNQFGSENYEFFEIITESMITASPVCNSVYGSNKKVLLPVISELLEFYRKLDNANEDEEYDIFKNLVLLIEKLERIVSEIPHDEL